MLPDHARIAWPSIPTNPVTRTGLLCISMLEELTTRIILRSDLLQPHRSIREVARGEARHRLGACGVATQCTSPADRPNSMRQVEQVCHGEMTVASPVLSLAQKTQRAASIRTSNAPNPGRTGAAPLPLLPLLGLLLGAELPPLPLLPLPVEVAVLLFPFACAAI